MSEHEPSAPVSSAPGPAGSSRSSRGVLWRGWLLLWRTMLAALVICAVYTGGGRLLMPLLVAQKDVVEARLGELLGTRVAIAALEGSWQGFSPGFAVEGLILQMDPADPNTRFAIDGGELSLDLWQSLRQRRPALNRVTLSGLDLSLQQSAGGRWSLRGLPPGERDYKDLILDLLLNTPDIRLREASVRIALANGAELPLQSVYLQLENQGSRHEVSLQFRLGASGQVQIAALRLQGDPRGDFEGTAWLSLDALDLRAPLAGMLPADWVLDEFMLQGDAWLELDAGGLRSLQTRVDDLRLRGELGPAGRADIVDGSLQLGAWPGIATDSTVSAWRFTLQDLVLQYNSVLLAPGRMNLHLPLAAGQPWTLQAESLDVATLAALAETLPLPERAAEALATLAPRGRLGPLRLESDRSGNYPDGFLLQTGFTALAVDAWRGAPAASELAGYAELVAGRGLAEVDGRNVSLHLPNLFANAWVYDRVNARVQWQLEPGAVTVSSSPISVSSPDLAGRVQFALHNTGMGTPAYRSDLSVGVGIDWMNVAIHADYLPTLERSADTMRWLDAALVDGRIVNSGFLLRSSGGMRDELDSLTHSSWYHVEDAALQFLPEWPPVQIARAGILVQDRDADVLSDSATIAGIAASRVAARVRPLAAGGSLLQLDVEAEGDTAAGLDFLRDTPVREQVGSVLDGWTGSGRLQLQLALQQALGADAPGQTLEVRVQPMAAGLFIAPYQLQLGALDGLVRYTHADGLAAQGLQATVFEHPVSLDLETRGGSGADRSLQVTARGRAAAEALAAWEGHGRFVQHLLGHTRGQLDYEADIGIPLDGASGRVPRLQLRSDLVGLTSSLPAPFAKAAAEVRQLQLDLAFHPGRLDLDLRHGDWLSGRLSLDDTGKPSGQLHFGPLNRAFNIRQSGAAEPGLLINGTVEAFDYDGWRGVAAGLAEEVGQDGSGLQDWLRLVDVHVGQLQLLDQVFEEIGVELLFRDEAWRIHATNQLLAGDIVIPEQNAPWEVDLEYLRFPPRPEPDPDADEPPEEEDLLEDIDPRTLPAFRFSTRELSIGPGNLGNWSFEFTPEPGGALIRNLGMQEAGSRIHGATSSEGAELHWQYRGGIHQSRFAGSFVAGDLAQVMPKWGHDANIVSRQASFVSALRWPGSPLAFSLRKASGDIDLAISSGRFVDIESGSSRLLGAFNFDSLVRRLELDFSDLYQRGFAFDSIRGKLGFTDGVVRFTSPLVIDGPSSRITIEGEINLPRETIAADMLVRIPLGENISMLAGLLGAWPIALSTYLASKIFADQVEDFTTIVYRLDGPWSNPQAGFAPPDEAVAVP